MTARPESSLRRGLEFAQSLAVLAAVLVACSPAATSRSTMEVFWRARLDGAVDGTPAVANLRVFAGSAGGEVAAWDLATGSAVWNDRGLGAISDSPAVLGGRVYVGTLAGHVLALDAADGARLWDWAGPPNAAMWSSPVLYRDLVLIGIASPYGDTPLVAGRVVALDAATGAERWNVCVRSGCPAGNGIWSTVSVDRAGVAFVGVGNPDDGVLAFDPLTGRHTWFHSLYPDQGRDLDVGARPLILVSAGRELVVEASVEGTLFALDAGNGDVVWSRRLVHGTAVHGLIASPASDGINLYVASASPPDGIFAIALADGSVVWHHDTSGPVYSAPVLGGGAIVFGVGAVFGNLGAGSVVELATDGRELSHFDTRSAVRAGPAVAGRFAIVGDYAGDLFVLSLSSS